MHPVLVVVQLSKHYCKNHILQAGHRFGCEQMQYSYFVGFFPLSLSGCCTVLIQARVSFTAIFTTKLKPYISPNYIFALFLFPGKGSCISCSTSNWRLQEITLSVGRKSLIAPVRSTKPWQSYSVPRTPSHAMPSCCLWDPSWRCRSVQLSSLHHVPLSGVHWRLLILLPTSTFFKLLRQLELQVSLMELIKHWYNWSIATGKFRPLMCFCSSLEDLPVVMNALIIQISLLLKVDKRWLICCLKISKQQACSSNPWENSSKLQNFMTHSKREHLRKWPDS